MKPPKPDDKNPAMTDSEHLDWLEKHRPAMFRNLSDKRNRKREKGC